MTTPTPAAKSLNALTSRLADACGECGPTKEHAAFCSAVKDRWAPWMAEEWKRKHIPMVVTEDGQMCDVVIDKNGEYSGFVAPELSSTEPTSFVMYPPGSLEDEDG